MNEFLLIVSIFVLYGGVLLFYRLFGPIGLYCYSAVATVLANIEVLILVDAFGMEMTLGNILFATTFIVTDILSENESKEAAQKAVLLSVGCSILFLLVSQSWLLYTPAASDWASPSIRAIFASTPRMMLASLGVYTVSQWIDVLLYHFWWNLTRCKVGDTRRFLWLRNNGSTMISQLINAVLFNVFAFWGIYSTSTLVSIILSTYAIYFVTSLVDTPVVYLARRIHDKEIA
ncbi:MAG: queuosine precursor transporter [Butyricicoccus sp.]|nr:queuosine precursor transporter [Butyricicoccus sp.]